MKEINFIRIITLKTFCLNNWAIFITLIVNLSDMLIYSKGFLDCLQPELFNAKGIDVGGTCSNYICAKGFYFEDTYTKNAYTKSVYIKNAYIKIVNTDDICIIDTYIRKACIRSACIDNIYEKVISIEDAYIKSNCFASACM